MEFCKVNLILNYLLTQKVLNNIEVPLLFLPSGITGLHEIYKSGGVVAFFRGNGLNCFKVNDIEKSYHEFDPSM